jgi:hypothetical protein
MSASMYFVRIRGKVMGPFGDAQLVSLRDRGQFKPFHEVSTDRILWTPASTLTHIFKPTLSSEPVNTGFESAQSNSGNDDGVANDGWFVADDEGNRKGPLDYKTVKSMVSSNQVSPDTMVWKAGMADWIPANQALPGLFGPKASGKKSAKETKKQEKLLEDLKKTRMGILLILIAGLVALLCAPLQPIAFVLAVIGLGFCMSAPSPAKGPATLTFYFFMATGLLWILWFVVSLFGWNVLVDFMDTIVEEAQGNRKALEVATAGAAAASLTFLGFISLSFMFALAMLFTCGGFMQFTLRKLAIVTGDSAIIKLSNINFIIYCVLSGLLVSLVYLLIVIPLLSINGFLLFSPLIFPKIIWTIIIIEAFVGLCSGVCYIITLIIIMQLYGKFGKMTAIEED